MLVVGMIAAQLRASRGRKYKSRLHMFLAFRPRFRGQCVMPSMQGAPRACPGRYNRPPPAQKKPAGKAAALVPLTWYYTETVRKCTAFSGRSSGFWCMAPVASDRQDRRYPLFAMDMAPESFICRRARRNCRKSLSESAATQKTGRTYVLPVFPFVSVYASASSNALYMTSLSGLRPVHISILSAA